MRTTTSLHGAGWLLLGVPLTLAACVGSLGDGESSGAAGGGPTGNEKPAAASPLARLTSTQYTATLHDLFAPIAVPDATLPNTVFVEGFDNNSGTQTPGAALIDALHANAVTVASEAMKSEAALLGCSPTTRAEEDDCARTSTAKLATKAFRRPVVDAEVADLVKLYTDLRSDGTTDFSTAMTLVIETILQEPDFVYRVELGTPIAGDPTRVQLTPYEMASRLSYLLWNTMPDDALFAAAKSGELATPEGIEKQARRLLADPRAHAAVLKFHSEWLRFSSMATLSKDATLYPSFTSDTAASLRDSSDKYVDSIFFGEGTLTALLTDTHAWVNDDLASIYGVPAPGGTDLKLVSVDPKQRAGILTSAGLMAGFAHETADSPVLRGVWVLDRFMCNEPPPPPKGVNTTLPAAVTGKPLTTRDRFATQHEQGSCAGCHHTIDGVGFAFENYDATGAWRTEDNTLPVDSSGWFSGGNGDLEGTFSGAVELGQKLAESKTVHACVASSWMRYALGVDHRGIDDKGLAPVLEAFEQSQLKLPELVVAITKSDAFRTRPIEL
jgi:uncharacterized protein DUF1592/uncharacterized protein DUF1588/uncharacterized protein DUF1595/uncharacterized protein DUF1585/uncharacterized protein DUF1587